jgi:hypothetical protein
MSAKTATAILLSIIISGVTSTGAMALPDDRIVILDVYDDPTDPNSDVVFTIELFMTADSGTSCESGPCGDVGWDITSIQFTQLQTGGDRVWVDDTPVVDATDGLWWVYHADENAPADDEFVMPPRMYGTAAAQNPQDLDLDYDFEGKDYSYSNPPYGDNTAAMVYSMVEEDNTPVRQSASTDEPEPISSTGVHDPD